MYSTDSSALPSQNSTYVIYKALLAFAILLAGSYAASSIRDGYSFGSVAPPERELSEVALSLAGWQGEELPENERLREILSAKSGIDRVYRNGDGGVIAVHAVWTDDYVKLHFPQQCYRESGWNEQGSSDVTVKSSNGTEIPAKILNFVQDGRKSCVLYWFQLGEHVFLDRVEHRLIRRKALWGKKEWPPLMKFMLDTPAGPEAEQRLLDLAGAIHGEFYSPPPPTAKSPAPGPAEGADRGDVTSHPVTARESSL